MKAGKPPNQTSSCHTSNKIISEKIISQGFDIILITIAPKSASGQLQLLSGNPLCYAHNKYI